LQSNSKVVVKRTKFWTFFPSQILRGRWSPKVAPALSPPSSSTSRGKV